MASTTTMYTVIAAVCMSLALCTVVTAISTAETDGQWTQLSPTGSQISTRKWHQGAVSGGKMYVTGGLSNGDNATFVYNTATNAWSELAPMSSVLKAGSMAASGGFLFAFGGLGEQDFGKLQVLRTTTTTNSLWELVTTTNQPPPRNGHTTTAVGGVVYVFGGWDQNIDYYNDMWAFDTTQLVVQKKQWVNIIPNGANGSPPPRNSMVMVVIGAKMYLFGGFYHDVSRGISVSCNSNDKCKYYNDLWTWTPPGSNLKSNSYSPWTHLTPTGSSAYPPGRWGAAGAAIGSNLYIFGGNSNRAVVLSDTWMYSTTTNLWKQLSPPGSVPNRRYAAVSVATGGMMYLFSGSYDQPDLWSFTPPTDVGGDCSNTYNYAPVSTSGLTAGLVIAILLGLTVLACVTLTYRKLSSIAGGGNNYQDMALPGPGL